MPLRHSARRQTVISAINTALTGVFITVVGLPHHIVLIGITFICGMLPVVGNLISNTVIVGIAFGINENSPAVSTPGSDWQLPQSRRDG